MPTALITVARIVGVPFLAGINLYLTVLVLGLLARFTSGVLGAEFEIFGNWWIIGIAAVLTVIEFVADKIPTVDHIWDSIHSVIRSPGGAVLAGIIASGSDPFWIVVAVLAGGAISFTTHSSKASFRAATTKTTGGQGNAFVSVVEDVVTFAGVILAVYAPVVLAVIVIIFLFALVYFGPKLARSLRINTLTSRYFFRNLYYNIRGWLNDDFVPNPKKTKMPAAAEGMINPHYPEFVSRVVIGKPFKRRMGWLLVWDDRIGIIKQNTLNKRRKIYYFDEIVATSLKKGNMHDRLKLVTDDAENIHISLFKGRNPSSVEVFDAIKEAIN